jgi:hypothetical protein
MTTNAAVLVRRRPRPEGDGAAADAGNAVAPAAKTTKRGRATGAIVCRSCDHLITDRRHRIEVQGKHRHRFMNPAGFVFVIGCFAEAIGCVVIGPDNLDYPWFANHAWRYAHCAGCAQLIGWQFRPHPATAAQPFFGLILDRLRDADPQ